VNASRERAFNVCTLYIRGAYAVVTMDERQLSLLRRKLDALSYAEPLDPVSGPLVHKILDDLVHTTESYRTLKLQHARQAQEISSFTTKVSGVWAGSWLPLRTEFCNHFPSAAGSAQAGRWQGDRREQSVARAARTTSRAV
jgi:hypothetical protein